MIKKENLIVIDINEDWSYGEINVDLKIFGQVCKNVELFIDNAVDINDNIVVNVNNYVDFLNSNKCKSILVSAYHKFVIAGGFFEDKNKTMTSDWYETLEIQKACIDLKSWCVGVEVIAGDNMGGDWYTVIIQLSGEDIDNILPIYG